MGNTVVRLEGGASSFWVRAFEFVRSVVGEGWVAIGIVGGIVEALPVMGHLPLVVEWRREGSRALVEGTVQLGMAKFWWL